MNAPTFEAFCRLWQEGETFVSVTVVEARGSVPQDPGSTLLVTKDGWIAGTVGGGRVEKKALEEALRLITVPGSPPTQLVEWNLQKDVGMTCGGVMWLYFQVYQQRSWEIVLFGAGHVAQALSRLLVQLDCRLTCYDTRREWLDRLPSSPRLRAVEVEDMPAQVKSLPKDAFVLLMTMGHATDAPILIEILKHHQPPYLGVIGSAAKARRLHKDLLENGLPEECGKQFFCPVGLPLGSNQPTEIAVSITAQLLQERDALYARSPGSG